MTNPKPTAEQIRQIKAQRSLQIKAGKRAVKLNDGPGYAAALAEVRVLNNWLHAYVTGPNAAVSA